MKMFIYTILVSITGIIILVACSNNIADLELGDCFNNNNKQAVGNIGEEIYNVEMVGCDEAHESEVYRIFYLPDSNWKGYDYIIEEANIGCYNGFKQYVGIEWEFSSLDVEYLHPTEDSWKNYDDRAITCYLVEGNYNKTFGSLKNSKR